MAAAVVHHKCTSTPGRSSGKDKKVVSEAESCQAKTNVVFAALLSLRAK